MASTFADRFIGEFGAGCLFVAGLAGMLFFAIRGAWEHYERPRGTLPKLALLVASILALCIVLSAGFRVYSKVTEPPSRAEPGIKQLIYRICAVDFEHGPGERLARVALELDPINPNEETIHIVGKPSFFIFDGVPSKNNHEGTSLDVVPQVSVDPKATRVPNIKDWIDFHPTRKMSGSVDGRYHYAFRYGRDEDSASQSFEINGTIKVIFGPNGIPLPGGTQFAPSGDKNITFDPTECPFWW